MRNRIELTREEVYALQKKLAFTSGVLQGLASSHGQKVGALVDETTETLDLIREDLHRRVWSD